MASDPSAVFDCVVASEVIEHVANVEDFTRHLCQVVKVREQNYNYNYLLGRCLIDGHLTLLC